MEGEGREENISEYGSYSERNCKFVAVMMVSVVISVLGSNFSNEDNF